jgi:hypothetical protein
MNRLGFLKRLGIGAAAVVVPSAFVNKENTKFIDSDSLKKPVDKLIPWKHKDWVETSSYCMSGTTMSATIEEMQRDVGNYKKLWGA